MTLLAGTFAWVATNWSLMRTALLQHAEMSLWSLGLALAIGIPLAIAVLGRERLAAVVINLVNTLRTIPSLAILAAALPILGIGLVPSVVALVVLALPPILLNTYVGLREVDPDLVDAAAGMGMTRGQILRKVQLPLAAPAIFAGMRTAAIQVISGATLAAFIGGGGLGDFITAGIAVMDQQRLLAGAIPIAVLALGVEILLGFAERRLFRNVHEGASAR
ncbi:ABC transporter permease [Bosea sp. (in: a-proteobacteria)]|uniref:ABC transporter permease n=1 Tax=Bosea sp. (in: a-proteobacteria) TaxID=1871050 RepID=UPI003B3B22AC